MLIISHETLLHVFWSKHDQLVVFHPDKAGTINGIEKEGRTNEENSYSSREELLALKPRCFY